MASFNRGQPPAWYSKVVHHRPGWVKAGSTGIGGLDCSYDGMSSKPASGRDIADALGLVHVVVIGAKHVHIWW